MTVDELRNRLEGVPGHLPVIVVRVGKRWPTDAEFTCAVYETDDETPSHFLIDADYEG